MLIKRLLFVLAFLLYCFYFAKCNNKLNIIIDTDCGIDDYRAISLFLEDERFNILGFIVSEGSLDVNKGSYKLFSLLKLYNKDNIPIYQNNYKIPIIPEWRNFNESLNWTKKSYKHISKSFNEFIEFFINENKKFTFIALGSLNSIFIVLKNNIKDNIEKIVWYNSSLENELSGFNYLCDTSAANFVLKQKFIKVDVISNISPESLLFDEVLFNVCKHSNSRISLNFYNFHKKSDAYKRLKEKHFFLHDELVYFYLVRPEFFLMNKSKKFYNVRYCNEINSNAILFLFKDILNNISTEIDGIVLKTFPEKAENFDYDLRFYVDSIKIKHGIEEWKAAILTNEIHGHLGIYSIIGVKMGILAREYFKAKLDELQVYSFAGFLPPFSCLNDGLQISTGATLGRGTIHIIDQKTVLPQAIFIKNDNAILIKLKYDIEQEIKSEISNAVVKYGLDDQSYWNYVRFIAIKYWYKLDRKNIFEVIKLDSEKLKDFNLKF